MKILAVDIGGTHVKALVSGQRTPRRFVSGPTMTPGRMVKQLKSLTADWAYQAVTLGYPGLVLNHRIVSEPHHLGNGWAAFDFRRAFGVKVQILNDAAMQALGSYEGGRMLFLGLGTGLGSAMIVDGLLEPMELAHLPYKKGRTYEDYVGIAGLKRLGKKKWRQSVVDVLERLRTALEPDDIVLGGGNAKKLHELPAGVRLGENDNAFRGGFRLWQSPRRSHSGHAIRIQHPATEAPRAKPARRRRVTSH